MEKYTNISQYRSNRMNLNKVMSNSRCHLGKMAAILDFQLFSYLDLRNASIYFVYQLCCKYKLLVNNKLVKTAFLTLMNFITLKITFRIASTNIIFLSSYD